MSDKRKPSGFLDNLIKSLKDVAEQNIKQMPNLDDLPHVEPRLRALYHEVYYVTMLGFHNVSIIMQGVLLEALVKEIIYKNERIDFQRPFGPAIRRCQSEGYLTDEEIGYLDDFKDSIRNIYQHFDVKKLTEGIPVLGWKIPLDPKNPTESILKGLSTIRQGKADAPAPITSDELRPIGHIVKEDIDKGRSMKLFLENDKFFKELAEKYLSP